MERKIYSYKRPNRLTAEQLCTLEGFSQAYAARHRTNGDIAIYDQGVAEMKEYITQTFGLELDTDKEFFVALAGICTATGLMADLIEKGVDAEDAKERIRYLFAGLNPSE